MIIRVTFKDPDAVYDALYEVAKEQCENKDGIHSKIGELDEQLSKWIELSEYITIEFDTEAGTATVVPKS